MFKFYPHPPTIIGWPYMRLTLNLRNHYRSHIIYGWKRYHEINGTRIHGSVIRSPRVLRSSGTHSRIFNISKWRTIVGHGKKVTLMTIFKLSLKTILSNFLQVEHWDFEYPNEIEFNIIGKVQDLTLRFLGS